MIEVLGVGAVMMCAPIFLGITLYCSSKVCP